MNNMKNPGPGLEFHHNELAIDARIEHYRGKYIYRGVQGREYEVIQSLFQELNHLAQFSNRQILWYTVIIYLQESFFQFRNTLPLHAGLAYRVDRLKRYAQVGEPPAFLPDIPHYIKFLEAFVKGVARMGVLMSTKLKVSAGYLQNRLDKSRSNFKKLLIPFDSEWPCQEWEDPFLLTIGNGIENLQKLADGAGPVFKKDTPLTEVPAAMKVVKLRISRISAHRRRALFNIDNFWNGLIP